MGILLEHDGIMLEEDTLLHEEQLDIELCDKEVDDKLLDFWLDELNAQLKLVEMQLRLEL